MTFAAPEVLLGLALVPLALLGYVAIQRRRARFAVRFTNLDLLAELVPRRPAWRRHVPVALYLGAVGVLVLGLARPSLTVAVPRDEATIILTIDVSRSMRAVDVAPTRLAAAQRAAEAFVDSLPGRIRVGLVAFSDAPALLVAPTADRDAVRAALGALRIGGGTALGDAIAASVAAARLVGEAPGDGALPPGDGDAARDDAGPLVATVLLSDGENSVGEREPLAAAREAAAIGMPVHAIALGTDEGVIDVVDAFGRTRPLEVPPDRTTLAAIAELTGGRFFEAPTAEELTAIYEGLGSRVGFDEEREEVTHLFAAAGLALVLAGGVLSAFWFNRFP